MIGFLEESEGVHSMTRLTIAWVMILLSALVGALVWYVVKGKAEAVVITAIAGAMLPLATKVVVAIINRNGPDDTK